MPGRMTLNITVYQTNVDILPELERRAKDLSPLFDDIIDTWSELNKQKFELAQGGEISGAQIFDVAWKGLSPGYLAWKTRHFPTGTLMVRTGELRASLTDPQGFFRRVEPERAIFGSPNDPDDVAKVRYNWKTRQAVFLSDPDQNMIRQKVSQFFNVSKTSIRQEVARMDIEFSAVSSS